MSEQIMRDLQYANQMYTFYRRLYRETNEVEYLRLFEQYYDQKTQIAVLGCQSASRSSASKSTAF